MYGFPTDPTPSGLLGWWLGYEPLRQGTIPLLRDIRRAGHEICIYTTSFRPPLQTRLAFLAQGARIQQFINADLHRRRMLALGSRFHSCTKYPPAFGIDVLIDDSEGVVLEGKQFGYPVIHIHPDDIDWTDTLRGRLGLG